MTMSFNKDRLAAAADPVAADDAVVVIKQKQPQSRTCSRSRHSELQLSKLELKYPELFKAIASLEPAFVILHPDGLWLQPRLFEGLKRGGLSYLNGWINDNPEACNGISHHGIMILNCLAIYKRFTTYDEVVQYLQDRGMGTAFFLQADSSEAEQQKSQQAAQQAIAKEKERLQSLVKDLEEQLTYEKMYREDVEKKLSQGKDPGDSVERIDKVIQDIARRLEEGKARLSESEVK